jgi:hypothetical protein
MLMATGLPVHDTGLGVSTAGWCSKNVLGMLMQKSSLGVLSMIWVSSCSACLGNVGNGGWLGNPTSF